MLHCVTSLVLIPSWSDGLSAFRWTGPRTWCEPPSRPGSWTTSVQATTSTSVSSPKEEWIISDRTRSPSLKTIGTQLDRKCPPLGYSWVQCARVSYCFLLEVKLQAFFDRPQFIYWISKTSFLSGGVPMVSADVNSVLVSLPGRWNTGTHKVQHQCWRRKWSHWN